MVDGQLRHANCALSSKTTKLLIICKINIHLFLPENMSHETLSKLENTFLIHKEEIKQKVNN